MAVIVSVDAIPGPSRDRMAETRQAVEDFLAAGVRYARVDGYGSTAKVFTQGLVRCISKYYRGMVAARKRGDDVYLERLGWDEDAHDEPVSETAAVPEPVPSDDATGDVVPDVVYRAKPKERKDPAAPEPAPAAKDRAHGETVSTAMVARPRWTRDELATIKATIAEHGADWDLVARNVNALGYANRSVGACKSYVFNRMRAGKDFRRTAEGSVEVVADE